MMFRSWRNSSKCFSRDYETMAMVIFSLLKIKQLVHAFSVHYRIMEHAGSLESTKEA